MIEVYADGNFVYNSASQVNGNELLTLNVHKVLNKSGTAEFKMRPNHAMYNSFVSMKTVVTILRDGELLFRGRALYPTDDFYNCRTITCEGERGFLRDAIMRPYLFTESPQVIFTELINTYNSQVETYKQFVVGDVTVTDANDYVRIESSNPETCSAVLDKLVERVGGYIEFTTNSSGQRVIHWNAELGYRSTQRIEFGENLLDFSRTGANTELATVLIPYGAKDESTGERVTIESVNNGLDYIEDAEAIALRGRITTSVTWDDVTEPANLLMKAQQELSHRKNILVSLELSAVDLSARDKDIDTFEVGDLVEIYSAPHGVDEDFLLTEREYDLLNPGNDTVVLGKEVATLTGADVAGDRNSASALHKVEHNIVSDYTLNVQQAVQELKTTLSSLIEQTSESIKMEVSETYATNGEIDKAIKTIYTQLADEFNFSFETLEKVVDDNDTYGREKFIEIEKYIRFIDGNIHLGNSESPFTLRIENERIVFLESGAEVAYLTNKKLYVTDGQFLRALRLGNFEFLPRRNGNLSLVKVD